MSELKSEGGGGGALAIAAAMTASISAEVGARELAPLMSVIVTTEDCPLPDLSSMTGFAPCAAASSKAAAASNKDDMWEEAANVEWIF